MLDQSSADLKEDIYNFFLLAFGHLIVLSM